MKTIEVSYRTRIIITVLLLLIFGLMMIYSASVAEALRDFGSKWYFVRLQFKWGLTGIVLMFITSRISPRVWKALAPYLLLGGLLLLIIVAIPGIGTKVQGARRWLVLPGITLQPSELIKFVQIIYLSSWLTRREISLGKFLSYLGIIAGLIMLQPDMGTAIVVSILAVSIYFLAGYPLSHLAVIGGLGALVAATLILLAPYRLARVATFFNPEADPLGSSYHIRQVILALGSGGMTGVGIGKSRQKYEYLPESTTDSIFAVVGEELGFVGSASLIAVFIYLISLLFKVAGRARDKFSGVLAGGVASWFTVQVLLNLSAMVALAPLTGVPLPLVSYGGSSLITIFLGLGLTLSVAREEKL